MIKRKLIWFFNKLMGVGTFFLLVMVMLFSLAKSAGMAERKFEELQSREVRRDFRDQLYWEYVERQKEEEKQNG